MAKTHKRGSGTDRFIMSVKAAYWLALLIIVAMALSTYLLLQSMMADHKQQESLIAMVSTQKTLSQRIVFLAHASEDREPARVRPLVERLAEATRQFETNNRRLLEWVDTSSSPEVNEIFFSEPHHLDFFSVNLVANSRRLIASLETILGIRTGANIYHGGIERAQLDEAGASATLAGFSSLENLLTSRSQATLDDMLEIHRLLFLATLAVICMIALFIFRPMTNLIRRRTIELVAARNKMAFIAVHDGLTGLYNRGYMRDRFDEVLQTAKAKGEKLAIVQIDLDRFKQVNDTLGHSAGDFVLVTTAERINAWARPDDICARLGGDEFLVVLPNAGSREEVAALVRDMLEQINTPIVYEGTTIFSRASAGIAMYPKDADNVTDLMVHGDLALYAAKRIGGGDVGLFSEELRQELEERKSLEADLAEAIEAKAFNVYFQPQVSLSSGKTTGVEALVRWRHPTRGVVSPGEFIPVAEKAGVMQAIGRIVMEKAIREASLWCRDGIEFGRVGINASGAELREADFTEFLFSTLERYGLSADKLSLEIVESVILDDDKSGIASKLRLIRAAGVHLELDDFGTGYASLTHVDPREIDRLKIDRRFVQNINADCHHAQIVRALSELARALGMSVVAEGAETDEELAALMELGCDEVQGYAIAFPMPCAEAHDWLAARSKLKALAPTHAQTARASA